MSFTVFLGNLPVWVTADDIKSWLSSENLVADAVKVIRNPETQESKGFAFIESPNQDEMNSIIRRFDRAPLEDQIASCQSRSAAEIRRRALARARLRSIAAIVRAPARWEQSAKRKVPMDVARPDPLPGKVLLQRNWPRFSSLQPSPGACGSKVIRMQWLSV